MIRDSFPQSVGVGRNLGVALAEKRTVGPIGTFGALGRALAPDPSTDPKSRTVCTISVKDWGSAGTMYTNFTCYGTGGSGLLVTPRQAPHRGGLRGRVDRFALSVGGEMARPRKTRGCRVDT